MAGVKKNPLFDGGDLLFDAVMTLHKQVDAQGFKPNTMIVSPETWEIIKGFRRCELRKGGSVFLG